MLTDSHCHLTDAQFDEDRDAVITRAPTAGSPHRAGCEDDLAGRRQDPSGSGPLLRQRHRIKLDTRAHRAGDRHAPQIASFAGGRLGLNHRLKHRRSIVE